MGWSLVEILGQVGLGCSQADACLSLVWIFLDFYVRGAGGAGVGRSEDGIRVC